MSVLLNYATEDSLELSCNPKALPSPSVRVMQFSTLPQAHGYIQAYVIIKAISNRAAKSALILMTWLRVSGLNLQHTPPPARIVLYCP
jgi:hypothetical protein